MARCCAGPSAYEAVQLAEAAAAAAEAARDETQVAVDAQSDWSGAAVITTDEAASAHYLRRRLTGNVTSLTVPSGTAGLAYSVVLELTQDATGSRTLTWPSTVKTPGNVNPTLSTGANDIDIIRLLWNGTSWFGVVWGQDFG